MSDSSIGCVPISVNYTELTQYQLTPSQRVYFAFLKKKLSAQLEMQGGGTSYLDTHSGVMALLSSAAEGWKQPYPGLPATMANNPTHLDVRELYELARLYEWEQFGK